MSSLAILVQIGQAVLSGFGLSGLLPAFVSAVLFLVLVGQVLSYFRKS